MIEIQFSNFLGIDEVESAIGNNKDTASKQEMLVNMYHVAMFDVAGLLLLLVWLQSYRVNGGFVKFRLPDIDNCRKARDFLVKWRMDRALKYTFNDDLTNLLVEDQFDYFNPPLVFYTDSGLFEEYGDLVVLKSHNLLEILPLTEITDNGNCRVSKAKINQIADSLSLKSVTPIIQKATGADQAWSEKFGRTLVYQALLNAFEHPDATIAFLAIAKKPNPKKRGSRLVISVADNGLTISDTIHESFIHDPKVPVEKKIFDDSLLSQYKINSNKVVYATREFTSSKPIDHPDPERGMGLYYLKTMTSQVKGETIIRCRNTSVRFKVPRNQTEPAANPRRVFQLDKGNIIRISIPIK